MDFQWQNVNAETHKLQEELDTVKERFEAQKTKNAQYQGLREQLDEQKYVIKDQELTIQKLKRELASVKESYGVDQNETRIRGIKERASSQQNRRCSTLVPKLDLTKVKPYEEHLRDK